MRSNLSNNEVIYTLTNNEEQHFQHEILAVWLIVAEKLQGAWACRNLSITVFIFRI